ncbi:hypothetical protein SBV1_gp09 [Sulfolobales Beppu virus 1]|nr:hypothetical protein SBV1_gp09 [Sulfolobales Beppu virus 1]
MNHLKYINQKTIEEFKLYYLSPKLIEDLKKVGEMDIYKG